MTEHWEFFWAIVAVGVTWNTCLQHSHFGVDGSLEFLWVRCDDAVWEGGLRWTSEAC